MKNSLFCCLIISSFLMVFIPQNLYAQTFKTGDIVYYKASRYIDYYYFQSPVYVIATVKKVIGSKALLSTDIYLYKCKKDDTYWKMTTTLNIAKPSGVMYLYYTWKASENNGYTKSTKHLKRYTDSTEREITKGKVSSSSKECSVLVGS